MSSSANAVVATLAIAVSVSGADKVVAIVNGQPIGSAAVEAASAQIGLNRTATAGGQQRQQHAEIVQLLIDDTLIRQFLRQHGPKINPSEVERQFDALVTMQKNKGQSLADYLRETKLTEAQVKENLLRMLQLAQYLEEHATDERLRQYFSANRELFDRAMVRPSHIVIRIAQSAPAADRQKAVDKLRALRADVVAGRIDFAAAAKAHSQCVTAAKGGDLGFIERKFQVDEVLARTAFTLKVGELSDVIETDLGYHLIWVKERKPGKPARYEDCAADVRECYETELKQGLMIELRKKATIEIK